MGDGSSWPCDNLPLRFQYLDEALYYRTLVTTPTGNTHIPKIENLAHDNKLVLGAVSNKKNICNAGQSSAGSPTLMQNNFRGGIRYARHRM